MEVNQQAETSLATKCSLKKYGEKRKDEIYIKQDEISYLVIFSLNLIYEIRFCLF